MSRKKPNASTEGRPNWETEVEHLSIQSRQIDFAKPLHGTYLTTGSRAQRGYRLSKFCMSFMGPAFRDAFKADPEKTMSEAGLSDYEKLVADYFKSVASKGAGQ